MAVYADRDLPAVATLAAEGIRVADLREAPADAVRVGVLNLMPLKIPTETDLLRAFSQCERDVAFTFFTTATHVSRNTPAEHISRFYGYLDEESMSGLDAVLITGAPVEKIDYEDVDYYTEFCGILDKANLGGLPALLLCWAAFAGFYRRFGVGRRQLTEKISGVFAHEIYRPGHPLMAGVDAPLYAPQSRFVTIPVSALQDKVIELVAGSDATGVHIAATPGLDEVMITGHGEYDVMTLLNEYNRDTLRGMNPSVPCNYFADDDPSGAIVNRWQEPGRRIFSNWISSTVYPRKLARERRPQAGER